VTQRLELIKRFEELIKADTDEQALQELLEIAPWLVSPEWTPITANRTLKVVRSALETHLSNEFNKEVRLSAIEYPGKRPDFIMISGHGVLELVEIKKPHYLFAESDNDRLINYVEAFDNFFDNEANAGVREDLRSYRITLVCDGTDLKKKGQLAFNDLRTQRKLEQKSWSVLLKDTVKIHSAFTSELSKA